MEETNAAGKSINEELEEAWARISQEKKLNRQIEAMIAFFRPEKPKKGQDNYESLAGEQTTGVQARWAAMSLEERHYIEEEFGIGCEWDTVSREEETDVKAREKIRKRHSGTLRNYVEGNSEPKGEGLVSFCTAMGLSPEEADAYLQNVCGRDGLYALNLDEFLLIQILEYNQENPDHRISGKDANRIISESSEEYRKYLEKELLKLIMEEEDSQDLFAIVSVYDALDTWYYKKDRKQNAGNRQNKIVDSLKKIAADGFQPLPDGIQPYRKRLQQAEKDMKEEFRRENEKKAEKSDILARQCRNYLQRYLEEAVGDMGVHARNTEYIRMFTSIGRNLAKTEESSGVLLPEVLRDDRKEKEEAWQRWLDSHGKCFVFESLGRKYTCTKLLERMRNGGTGIQKEYVSRLCKCMDYVQVTKNLKSKKSTDVINVSSWIQNYTANRAKVTRKSLICLILLAHADDEEPGELRKSYEESILLVNYHLGNAYFGELNPCIESDAFLLMSLHILADHRHQGISTQEIIRQINNAIAAEVKRSENDYRQGVWKHWQHLQFIYKQTRKHAESLT